VKTSRAGYLLYSALFVIAPHVGLGDHLPASLVARGRPEVLLAGKSIRRPYASLKEIEGKWGPPTAVSESKDRNLCDRLLSWNLQNVTVTVSVGCTPPGNPVVYTVEIKGTDPARKFSTGRGLCLGDPLEKIYSLYGRRSLLSKGLDGREITVQWSNGAELNATVAEGNRIVRIQLLPQVE